MNKETTLSIIVVLVLVVAAGAAYFYYVLPRPNAAAPLPPAATPDNSVIAGPVTSVSAGSITLKKQDGTSKTLAVTSDTKVVQSSGSASIPKTLGDIKVGAMVLVNPAQDGSAGSIIIVEAPPAPPVQ